MSQVETVAGWIAATVMVVGVAWAPVSCNSNNNAKIEAAIERGVDPIKARCAFSSSNEGACTVAATLGRGGNP